MQLAHELGHAEQDIKGELNGINFDEIEEENRVTTESKIASELGEPTRNNYYDVQDTIETDGPTSTTPPTGIDKNWIDTPPSGGPYPAVANIPSSGGKY